MAGLVASTGMSRIVRVVLLVGLFVAVTYSEDHLPGWSANASQTAPSESSRVKRWMDHVFRGGLGVNSNSIGNFFFGAGKRIVHIARMGPTGQTLKDGQENWGYVPWAAKMDMDIDGIYVMLGPHHYKKNVAYLPPEEGGVPPDSMSEAIEYHFLFDNDEFRFEKRRPPNGEIVETKSVIVFGGEGPLTKETCDKGALHVVWDKEREFEVARLMCITHIRWMTFWARLDTCLRYASGLVSTIRGFYNSFELVGEREALHPGECTEQDISSRTNVREQKHLPFNIHIKASHTYQPNAAFTEYDISGEYELDFAVRKNFWHRKPYTDSNGRGYYFDYYFDKLNVVDTNTNKTIKRFHVPGDNPLIWSRCRAGLRSSLWDKDEMREVARIWCGTRQAASTERTRPMCWQYPSGRADNFPNEDSVRDMEQFFGPLRMLHEGDCTVEEIGAPEEAPGAPFFVLLIVISGTCLGCVTIASVIIAAAFSCCYTRIVPVSRRRAAGFKPMVQGSSYDNQSDTAKDGSQEDDPSSSREAVASGQSGIPIGRRRHSSMNAIGDADSYSAPPG